MEVFLELALAVSLNLYIVDWNTSYPAIKYSNILSVIIFITLILICIFLIIFYAKNLDRLNDTTFKARYGTGVEGTNRKKTFNKRSIPVNLGFFFGRRIAFVASVILLENFLWAQLAIHINISVFMIIFLFTFCPFESLFAARIAVMDECTNLVLSYCLICFTDFVPEAEIRSKIGLLYIAVVLVNVLVHLIFLLLDVRSKSKLICKRCFNKLKANRSSTRIRAQIKKQKNLRAQRQQTGSGISVVYIEIPITPRNYNCPFRRFRNFVAFFEKPLEIIPEENAHIEDLNESFKS
jgi:hypothetical protein